MAHTSGDELVLGFGLSLSVLLFITVAVTFVMVTTLVKLVRNKRANHKIVKELTQIKVDTIYDEIVTRSPPGSPGVDTEKNIAYENIKVIKAV